jgi:hypothetical protein
MSIDINNLMRGTLSKTLMQQQPKVSAFSKPPANGTPGSFELKNSNKENPDNLNIDLAPKDWRVIPKDQPEEAKKITGFIKQQFDLSYRSRQEMELEWVMATAFFEGRQWFRINSQARNLESLQNEHEPNRYMTVNKMRPLIDGVVGKLTQCAPDSSAVPISSNPVDLMASDEANFIVNHYNRKFDRETQTKERVRWACVCGTSFLKVFWDASHEQIVPQMDATGTEVIGHTSMRVGDVVEQILPAFDIYFDPTAKRDADIRWMIHAMVKPLSWFVDKYGEDGKLVKPDGQTGTNAGYVDTYLDGTNGNGRGWVPPSPSNLGNTDTKKQAAIVYEYWEKPTALYPSGRYIVSTNSCLLYAGPWPYKKKDSFPFIPLRWQPRSGTPYGYSLGWDLCSLQLTYNRVYSRLIEQFESQKDYILVENLSGVGADAYDNTGDSIDDKNRIYRRINYKRGSHPPAIQRAPGIGSDLFPLLQMLEKDMMDVAGLHDVSQGQASAGTPAESVRLLQRSDNTQHSFIRADIEISASKIKEWEVSLIEQFAIVPFIGNIQGKMLPQDQIQQGVMRFDALRSGGQYRIVYIPGSSMDDSPDQKLQKLAALRQMGVFGDPTDPDTNRLFIELANIPHASRIYQHLDQQAQKMAMMQQQQAAMMQQQAAMEAQAKQEQFNPEVEQMKMQLDLQKQQTLIQAKLEADISLHAAKAGIDAQQNEEYAMTELGKSQMMEPEVPIDAMGGQQQPPMPQQSMPQMLPQSGAQQPPTMGGMF